MKKWEKKEKEDQHLLGLTKTKASGSLWYSPGDGKSSIFLVDSKQTDKKSYSITADTWDKLFGEALFSKRLPLLSIKIQDKCDIVVMDREDFIMLLEDIQKGLVLFRTSLNKPVVESQNHFRQKKTSKM